MSRITLLPEGGGDEKLINEGTEYAGNEQEQD